MCIVDPTRYYVAICKRADSYRVVECCILYIIGTGDVHRGPDALLCAPSTAY